MRPASTRDDFSAQVRKRAAEAVGYACSICEAGTVGPHKDPGRSVSVGVAAHISAAAPGGPRYSAELSRQYRASIANAIWLCQTCSVKIDRDTTEFTEGELLRLKRDAIQRAKTRLGRPPEGASALSDTQVIQNFVDVFDRPAFLDGIHGERSLTNFRKAVEDTLLAINTGVHRTRDGLVIGKHPSKNRLRARGLRREMAEIGTLLRATMQGYDRAIRDGRVTMTDGSIRDTDFGKWLELSRQDVLDRFTRVCQSGHVATPWAAGRTSRTK